MNRHTERFAGSTDHHGGIVCTSLLTNHPAARQSVCCKMRHLEEKFVGLGKEVWYGWVGGMMMMIERGVCHQEIGVQMPGNGPGADGWDVSTL